MRLLALPLLLLMACNCATAAKVAQVDAPELSSPPTPPPVVKVVKAGFQLPSKNEGDRYWVPAISFEGTIDNGAAETIASIVQQGSEKGVDALILMWNTSGGSSDAALKIVRTMEDAPFQVICVADYEMESAGYYVLQGCDHRLMTKRTTLMTHDPSYNWQNVRLNATDLRNYADDLSAASRAAAEHNAHKMKITPKALLKKLAGGRAWYFTWEEALKVGAVDGVVESELSVQKSWRKDKSDPADMLKP